MRRMTPIPWFVALAGITHAATPLGTAWTYQGELKQNGSPVNDTCDLAFSLWDAAGSGHPPSGGTQIGSTLTFDGQGGNPPPISVANGLFTVELDFGAGTFNGDARWLAIAAACPSGDPSVTLGPRQPVTATPYALFASRPWQTNGSNVFHDAGNVGVGTSSPAERLSVAGIVQSTIGGFRFPDGTVQTTAATTGGGTVTSVSQGLGISLTPNPLTTTGTVAIDPAVVPQLAASNTFDGLQIFAGGMWLASFQMSAGAGFGKVLQCDGSGNGTWQNDGLVLPYSGTTTVASAPAFRIYNLGSAGAGIEAQGFGTGVAGVAAGSASVGGSFQSGSSDGTGVLGVGGARGGRFQCTSPGGTGVRGEVGAGSGVNYAVYGYAGSSPENFGGYFVGRGYFSGDVGIGTTTPAAKLDVSGTARITGFQLPTGAGAGKVLQCDGSGNGTWQNDGLTLPYSGNVSRPGGLSAFSITNTGDGGTALYALSNVGSGAGVVGVAGTTGATGASAGGWFEAFGTEGTGVFGKHSHGSGTAPGGHGITKSTSSYAVGVLGEVDVTNPGSYSAAVRGINRGTGGTGIGVWGSQEGSGWGVYGTTAGGRGVYGYASGTSGTNYAIYGENPNVSGYAGYFTGRVHVAGTLSKSAGAFKIDHPLDPANRYLLHSFVESPDMKNVYDGLAVLDERGEAWVELPAWFEALNRAFRYQLTAVGAPAPYLHVARRIERNRFQISGGPAGLEVSRQVTGVRRDPYAEAHRIPTEEDKRGTERGKYQHPELYGQPAEKGMDYREDREVPPAAGPDGTQR